MLKTKTLKKTAQLFFLDRKKVVQEKTTEVVQKTQVGGKRAMGTGQNKVTKEETTIQAQVRTAEKKEIMAKTNLAVWKEIKNKLEGEREVEVKEIMVVSKIQFLLMDYTLDQIKYLSFPEPTITRRSILGSDCQSYETERAEREFRWRWRTETSLKSWALMIKIESSKQTWTRRTEKWTNEDQYFLSSCRSQKCKT